MGGKGAGAGAGGSTGGNGSGIGVLMTRGYPAAEPANHR